MQDEKCWISCRAGQPGYYDIKRNFVGAELIHNFK